MLDFELVTPTRFVFGRGRADEVGRECRSLGATRVLVVFGGGSVRRNGLLDRVLASLKNAGLEAATLGGAKANPLDSLVYEGIRLCRGEHVDLVLGIGGGSAVDTAKAIAIGSADEDPDGDFWDYYSRQRSPVKRLLLGTIVTLPGTGTEGSNSSVIVHTPDRQKRGLRSDLNRPDFSILDPELAASLPPHQVACGTSDIISHALERYFTQTTGVQLTDRLGEALIRAVIEVAPAAVANPAGEDAMANLMWAAMVAHNGYLGVGREEDWSVHALDHEMGGLYDTTHGAGLAALYPAWLQYHLPHRPVRLAQFAERIFDVVPDPDQPETVARAGIRQLGKFYQSIGLATNIRDLGVKREDLPLLASRAKRNPDGTCGHFLPLRDADILAIYELAYDWSLERLET